MEQMKLERTLAAPYKLYGVPLESAETARSTPYVVRWYLDIADTTQGPLTVSGVTQACAEALAEAIRTRGYDPEPYVAPQGAH